MAAPAPDPDKIATIVEDKLVAALRTNVPPNDAQPLAKMKTKTYAAAIALASIVTTPSQGGGINTGKGIYPSCKRLVDSALFRGCGEVLCFRDSFYNLNDDTYTLLCKRRGRVGYPVG